MEPPSATLSAPELDMGSLSRGRLVSVIIANYNRCALLEAAIKSVLSQSYANLEVIVVDNGSTDGSRRMVSEIEDRRLQLVPLAENVGFARANNLGIARSRGDYIALLNNDAVAQPTWIQALVSVADTNSEQVGMFASKILFWESGAIDKVGHLIFLDGQNRGRGAGKVDLGQFEVLEEALFPDGCAAFYRRKLFEDIGGFDEDFFAYADDADLGLRARWRGWTCLYVPGAVVSHRKSSTAGPYSTTKVYWVERNRLWLAVKNMPLPLLLANPFFTLYRFFWNFVAAIVGRGAAGNFLRETSWFSALKTHCKADWDGILGMTGVWKKRHKIRARRRLTDWAFLRLIWRFRISARRLAFDD